MKVLENSFAQLRRSILQKNEQWLSLGLSLAVHFLLLLAVNALLNLPEISHRFTGRSAALNFMIHEIELNRIAEKKLFAAKKSPQLTSSSTSSASNLPPVSQSINDALQPPALNSNFSGHQNHHYENGTALNHVEKFTSPLPEPLHSLPNTARVMPKLMPYKFAMPSSQRKIILKKINEIVSKPLTFTARDSSFILEKNGQNFQFNLQHRPAQSSTELDELLVEVSTVDGSDTLTTQLRMQRLAFSQFAQFVDYWDPQVALHDDEFDGRFHSNSAILISGSGGTQPKFRGKVTTASYSIRSSEPLFLIDNREVFIEGLEQGAAPIPLPRVFHGVPKDANFTAARVHSFNEETWITFNGDGTYTWHPATLPNAKRHENLSREPQTIIGRGRAKLHIQGIVKGKLLIYGDNDIIIGGDLLYAHDPESFPQSEDFLGLVSNKDIEIAPPEITGPGDLKIYAAIFAKGRFRVPDLNTRQTGTLHIYGSLSAGSITATEPRFATRIRFDKRFDKMRPPNFPMTNRYETAEWDERWRVK